MNWQERKTRRHQRDPKRIEERLEKRERNRRCAEARRKREEAAAAKQFTLVLTFASALGRVVGDMIAETMKAKGFEIPSVPAARDDATPELDSDSVH